MIVLYYIISIKSRMSSEKFSFCIKQLFLKYYDEKTKKTQDYFMTLLFCAFINRLQESNITTFDKKIFSKFMSDNFNQIYSVVYEDIKLEIDVNNKYYNYIFSKKGERHWDRNIFNIYDFAFKLFNKIVIDEISCILYNNISYNKNEIFSRLDKLRKVFYQKYICFELSLTVLSNTIFNFLNSNSDKITPKIISEYEIYVGEYFEIDFNDKLFFNILTNFSFEDFKKFFEILKNNFAKFTLCSKKLASFIKSKINFLKYYEKIVFALNYKYDNNINAVALTNTTGNNFLKIK